MRQHAVVVLGVVCLLIVGCGSSEDGGGSDDASSGPAHKECKKPSAATLDRITSTFVAPAKVVAAYQVKDTETAGLVSVVVGTDGFPKGVSHKPDETPAPSYALYKGKLYTSSGQAVRYSGDTLPNVTDNPDLLTAAYAPSNDLAFDCVKADL